MRMAFGADLPDGCLLFRAIDSAPVWFTDELDSKRQNDIADPNIMDKYSLSWDKVKSYPKMLLIRFQMALRLMANNTSQLINIMS